MDKDLVEERLGFPAGLLRWPLASRAVAGPLAQTLHVHRWVEGRPSRAALVALLSSHLPFLMAVAVAAVYFEVSENCLDSSTVHTYEFARRYRHKSQIAYRLSRKPSVRLVPIGPLAGVASTTVFGQAPISSGSFALRGLVDGS